MNSYDEAKNAIDQAIQKLGLQKCAQYLLQKHQELIKVIKEVENEIKLSQEQIIEQEPDFAVKETQSKQDNFTQTKNKFIDMVVNQSFTTTVHQDSGYKHYFLLRTSKGEIVAGGQDHYIYIYKDDSFNQHYKTYVGAYVMCGLEVNGKLYLGLWDQKILVLNINSLDKIKKVIATPNNMNKMLLFSADQYIICGGWFGYIIVIQTDQDNIVHTTRIYNDDPNHCERYVYDMLKTQKENQFIFTIPGEATLITVDQDELKNIKMSWKKLEDYSVLEKHLQIELSLSMYIQEYSINDHHKHKNAIEYIVGYDAVKFPYILYKDNEAIYLVDTDNKEIHKIMNSEFIGCRRFHSLISYKDEKCLKILTIEHGRWENSTRTIRTLIFNNIFKIIYPNIANYDKFNVQNQSLPNLDCYNTQL